MQHEIEPVLSMYGGNRATVRCVDWNLAVRRTLHLRMSSPVQAGDMIAGDEASQLCAWTTSPSAPVPPPPTV